MNQASLQSIEQNHHITRKTDGEFLLEYQRGLLLGLLESGRLNQMQYNYAERKLQEQMASLCN